MPSCTMNLGLMSMKTAEELQFLSFLPFPTSYHSAAHKRYRNQVERVGTGCGFMTTAGITEGREKQDEKMKAEVQMCSLKL